MEPRTENKLGALSLKIGGIVALATPIILGLASSGNKDNLEFAVNSILILWPIALVLLGMGQAASRNN